MSFQPVVPISGLAGWQFLQRTAETQKSAFVEGVAVTRATDAFRERISQVRTAEDLVEDRELLQVALGAFGLDDDIANKAFITQILEGGTTDDGALANRLADKRYLAMTEAFGFEGQIPRTQLSFFADEIVARYEDKQFQLAVGEQDNDMRLAMNLRSELSDIVESTASDAAKWFGIMGSAPLREVFESALGFPSSFGAIDLDQQLESFQERARSVFGTDEVADFLEPENEEKLIRLFLVRSEAEAFSQASNGSIALTLLQSSVISYDQL